MTKIIGGSSSKKIAYDLSINLNIDYIEPIFTRFADGELRVQLPWSLYEEEVIIVQSTCRPANDHLMELLLLIDAARRAGSRKVIAVVPYLGYSRQDRVSYKGGPISAKLIATMLEAAGLDHIITLDLHSEQVEGFFKIGIQNIDLAQFFAACLERSYDMVVVSPDIGGLIRAKRLADIFQCELAIINKTRKKHNSCEMNSIIGDVVGKNCVIVDDIVDTCDTLCKAARLLKDAGAKTIQVAVTHAVLSNDAKHKLSIAPIDRIFTTNTIPQELDANRFKILDIVPIVEKAIKLLNV